MGKLSLSLATVLILSACKSAPFKVQPLSTMIEQVPESPKEDLDQGLREGAALRYRRAKSPSFAIIKGFYTLPQAHPYGAVTVVQGFSYDTSVQIVHTEKPAAGYALEEMSGQEAQSLSKAINTLLDIGVNIRELSMSDAVNIAKAEQEAAKSKKAVAFSATVLPKVDCLMSIYKSHSSKGPILVGRVVKTDGKLLAFRTLAQGEGQDKVSQLVLSLFEDTINRLP